MWNLLIRRTIKNYENIESNEVRENYGKIVSIAGFLGNIVLFLSKFLIGIFLGSVSIMADSFNNLADTASSLISFISFKISNKPADREHPFGHGRTEYIASFIVAITILLLGYQFLTSSIDKIINPTEVSLNVISLFILILGILIKAWLSYFNYYVGKKINSPVLKATAIDARNDVFITCITIFSVIFTNFSGIIIDGYAGVVVALFLLYAGFSLSKDMLSQLLGEAIEPALAEKIRQSVLVYDGIVGVHDLIVHNYGPNRYMATIHVEVPETTHILESHSIVDLIEKEVGEKYDLLLVIHMDPINVEDKKLFKLKEIIKLELKKIDTNMHAHEFKFVYIEEIKNLSLELEVPHSYTQQQIEEIKEIINIKVKQFETKLNTIIYTESGYTRN